MNCILHTKVSPVHSPGAPPTSFFFTYFLALIVLSPQGPHPLKMGLVLQQRRQSEKENNNAAEFRIQKDGSHVWIDMRAKKGGHVTV